MSRLPSRQCAAVPKLLPTPNFAWPSVALRQQLQLMLMLMLLTLLLSLGMAGPAAAHKPSDSYLALQTGEGPSAGQLLGQWDIALRDLEHAIGLDADGDGQITWGELKARHPAIEAYALARLGVRAGSQACQLSATEHLVNQHSDGAYAVIRFTVGCPDAPGAAIELDYRLFADMDSTHRGLLRWQSSGKTTTAVLGPDRPTISLTPAAPTSWFATLLDYGEEGVWHIWIGIDHVLFLVCLLLPAVFRPGTREPVGRLGPAFWDVARVVTAFTAAHSITLSLAALQWVVLPSRVVESAIALSVVLAALNNLKPLVTGRRWLVAFVFGLIHGFGFASVLADLGLPSDALFVALAGFNMGVELGQLAIVAVVLPLAYALRFSALYRSVIFTGGSVAVALLAAIWLAERWMGWDLMPW
jgi:hypothetical protein